MSAVPIPDPGSGKNKTIQLLEGELPSPINRLPVVFSVPVVRLQVRSAPKHVLCWKGVSDAVSCLKVDPL